MTTPHTEPESVDIRDPSMPWWDLLTATVPFRPRDDTDYLLWQNADGSTEVTARGLAALRALDALVDGLSEQGRRWLIEGGYTPELRRAGIMDGCRVTNLGRAARARHGFACVPTVTDDADPIDVWARRTAPALTDKQWSVYLEWDTSVCGPISVRGAALLAELDRIASGIGTDRRGDDEHEQGTDAERHVGWCGGDMRKPTWEEYLDDFNEGAQAVILAVREACERDSLDVYGEDFDYRDGYFLLSDGRVFSCSMRAWGDLRQAMVGKREGYMRYYMRFCAGIPDGSPRAAHPMREPAKEEPKE